MAVDETHAIVDLEEVKVYKRLESDQYDPQLEMLIDAISLLFESECGGRVFIQATYTDKYFDGTGNRILLLPHYPITSVTSIHEDDALLVVGNEYDYVIYGDEGQGYIERMGNWSEGYKNIKITYQAGYTLANVPKDLKLAAMIMIEKEFQKEENKAGAESTRSFTDMSLTWDFSQDEFVKKTLAKYRRIGL